MDPVSAENSWWNGLNRPGLDPARADVAVLGLPFDGAVSYRRGAAEAPDRIRSVSGHISPTTEDGLSLDHLSVVDIGNLEQGDLNQADYFDRIEEKAAGLFKVTFPTFIGGDHSVTIPLIKAAAVSWGADLGIIHLDAHLDLCAELDGNPLSHGCTHRRITEQSDLVIDQVCFVGIRSFETQELNYLQNKRPNIFTAAEIYRQGMEKTAEQVKERLGSRSVFYLTLDIDFLDPSTAPGTGTPKPGGFTTRELFTFFRSLAGLKVIGMDLVEVSPPLDHNDITSFAAQRAITEAWGLFIQKSA